MTNTKCDCEIGMCTHRKDCRQLAVSQPEVRTEQADNDLGIVLSALHLLEEAVGETFDDEGGIIAQIEADYKARQPALIEASRRPAQAAIDREEVIRLRSALQAIAQTPSACAGRKMQEMAETSWRESISRDTSPVSSAEGK